MTQGAEEIRKTERSLGLQDREKVAFVDYLGRILLPAWSGGLPTQRDGQLYDKGFIFQDQDPTTKGPLLRPVNGPARRSLLQFFVQRRPMIQVDVRTPLSLSSPGAPNTLPVDEAAIIQN